MRYAFWVDRGGTFTDCILHDRQSGRLEVTKVLSSPEARKLMASAGVDVATSSPEDFAKLLKSEHERWGKVVKDTGAQVN